MGLERNPELPLDTNLFIFWENVSKNEDDINFRLANAVSSYLDGIKLVQNPEVFKSYSVYVPNSVKDFLDKLSHSREYYALKYAYAGDSLEIFYRTNRSWRGTDLVKLNYLFWKRKAVNADNLYKYWDEESKKTSIIKVSDVCIANALQYRATKYGCLMMSEEVRLGAKPIFAPTGERKLTYEFLDKIIKRNLAQSAFSK